MRDVAERCGVSRATVSRVFSNNREHQSEATIKRVLEVAREMGYDPDRFQGARRLVSSQYGQSTLSHIIGVFFRHHGFSQSTYFHRLLQGILYTLDQTNFEACTSDWRRVQLSKSLPAVYRRGDIDGIVTMAQTESWFYIHQFLRREPHFGDRPVVGLIEPLQFCSAVYPNNVSAGYQLMKHLLDLGHRHILQFYDKDLVDDTVVKHQRMKGFWMALQEKGLELPKHLPLGKRSLSEGSIYHPSNETLLLKMLEKHPEITAIIGFEDTHAGEIHNILVRNGYRVPEDISLAGFDDTEPILGALGRNTLTTVRLPLTEIGMEGTKLLVRRITGKEKKDKDIVLPTELIVRTTTGPPSRERLKSDLNPRTFAT